MINSDSISSAKLNFYRFGGYGDYGSDLKYDMAAIYSLHNAQSGWSESWDMDQAQWEWDGDENVTIGDAVDEISYEPKTTGWFTYDVTESIKNMLNGETDNNGFVLKCKVTGTLQMSGNQSGFYSSEYAELELRPKLEIIYRGDPVSITKDAKLNITGVIQNDDLCDIKIYDISGKLIHELNNVRYGSRLKVLKNIESNKMMVMKIRNKKGMSVIQKIKGVSHKLR